MHRKYELSLKDVLDISDVATNFFAWNKQGDA